MKRQAVQSANVWSLKLRAYFFGFDMNISIQSKVCTYCTLHILCKCACTQNSQRYEMILKSVC